MIQRLRSLVELPGQILLGWRLFVDPRVPAFTKIVAAAAILLLLSPLDVLDWVPFVGGAGSLALVAMVLRSFINAAPEDVREEHMASLGLK
jgi:uncharacterized membrane protein YkvA (DUF1232 family)